MCYGSNAFLSSLVIDCRMIITDDIPDIKEPDHHNTLILSHPSELISSAQGQHIKANCAIMWGNGDFAIDIETDDWVNYPSSKVTLGFGLDHR